MIGNITILTGAGISQESGIPVFRTSSSGNSNSEEVGLWNGHPLEEVATYEGFLHDKNKVHQFYNDLRMKVMNVSPNLAHVALSKLESTWTYGKVTIITQNVDDLHERAGSKNVIHMHGELNSLWCEHCDKHFPFFEESSTDTECPFCHKKTLRPDIVWFGEDIYRMDDILITLRNTSLFLVIGTSSAVYPAASFADMAKRYGATTIQLNLDPTSSPHHFDHYLYGKASEIVPSFIQNLQQKGNLDFLKDKI
ncbi:MAG: NAD-dependent deacylase [Succinivibrionaceae bacterium]|nr:NAD-dependent deacylase [Ruminobacter sp.]MEE1340186.1 NAD-dependent deacylase [Succinivibrionaceae bacterium]